MIIPLRPPGIDAAKPLPDNKSFGGNRYEKDQWYLNHCGIPDGIGHMRFDGGDPSVVVAVIDTGVDIDHEVCGNIWKNTGEIPGNGIDDDGNGYIDDYCGVNVITGKGDGDDDNGHGTHVAGIIAAKNNFVGVLGIAYNVKIMPVKAAMASGYLNQSANRQGGNLRLPKRRGGYQYVLRRLCLLPCRAGRSCRGIYPLRACSLCR